MKISSSRWRRAAAAVVTAGAVASATVVAGPDASATPKPTTPRRANYNYCADAHHTAWWTTGPGSAGVARTTFGAQLCYSVGPYGTTFTAAYPYIEGDVYGLGYSLGVHHDLHGAHVMYQDATRVWIQGQESLYNCVAYYIPICSFTQKNTWNWVFPVIGPSIPAIAQSRNDYHLHWNPQ